VTVASRNGMAQEKRQERSDREQGAPKGRMFGKKCQREPENINEIQIGA
jgi:hypothetical protein